MVTGDRTHRAGVWCREYPRLAALFGHLQETCRLIVGRKNDRAVGRPGRTDQGAGDAADYCGCQRAATHQGLLNQARRGEPQPSAIRREEGRGCRLCARERCELSLIECSQHGLRIIRAVPRDVDHGPAIRRDHEIMRRPAERKGIRADHRHRKASSLDVGSLSERPSCPTANGQRRSHRGRAR